MTKSSSDDAKLRQSISFTKQQHKALAEIAEQYNVSFCWVVRYACDQFVQETRAAKVSLPNLSAERQTE